MPIFGLFQIPTRRCSSFVTRKRILSIWAQRVKSFHTFGLLKIYLKSVQEFVLYKSIAINFLGHSSLCSASASVCAFNRLSMFSCKVEAPYCLNAEQAREYMLLLNMDASSIGWITYMKLAEGTVFLLPECTMVMQHYGKNATKESIASGHKSRTIRISDELCIVNLRWMGSRKYFKISIS